MRISIGAVVAISARIYSGSSVIRMIMGSDIETPSFLRKTPPISLDRHPPPYPVSDYGHRSNAAANYSGDAGASTGAVTAMYNRGSNRPYIKTIMSVYIRVVVGHI